MDIGKQGWPILQIMEFDEGIDLHLSGEDEIRDGRVVLRQAAPVADGRDAERRSPIAGWRWWTSVLAGCQSTSMNR